MRLLRLERCDQTETSRRVFRAHLTGYEYINFSPVIFVIGEALIYLSARQVGKATGDYGVHRLPVLQQTNHVVDTDTRAGHDGIASSDILQSPDVCIFCSEHCTSKEFGSLVYFLPISHR